MREFLITFVAVLAALFVFERIDFALVDDEDDVEAMDYFGNSEPPIGYKF